MTRDSPGVTATDSLTPVSVAATAWTKHDARTQQEIDPRERHPRTEATRTMDALAVLDALIAQPGRHAVLRRDLVEDLQRLGKDTRVSDAHYLLDEGIRRDTEPLRQLRYLAKVEQPLAAEHVRHDALSTDLR